MAKKIKVYPIPSIEEGRAIQVPDLSIDGIPFLEGRNVRTRDGNIIDVLEILFQGFPKEQMTMAHITEGIRLKAQLTESVDKNDGFVVLEDSTYNWAKQVLQNEMIGVKMLGFNLPNVLKVMEEVVNDTKDTPK